MKPLPLIAAAFFLGLSAVVAGGIVLSSTADPQATAADSSPVASRPSPDDTVGRYSIFRPPPPPREDPPLEEEAYEWVEDAYLPPSGATASPSRRSVPVARAASRRDPRLRYSTVHELAAEVGSPAVVVLYGTNCPLSQHLMPGLQRLAARYGPQGVRFHVVNDDDDHPFYDVPAFLAETGARFEPRRLEPWRPGELSSAFARFGSRTIQGGATYMRPVVIVRGRSGEIVAEGQGVSDADAVEVAIRYALGMEALDR